MASLGFILDDSDARGMLESAVVDPEGRIDVDRLLQRAGKDSDLFCIGFNKGDSMPTRQVNDALRCSA